MSSQKRFWVGLTITVVLAAAVCGLMAVFAFVTNDKIQIDQPKPTLTSPSRVRR